LKNRTIYFWTCDSSRNTGEGKLALFFLDDLKKNYNVKKINTLSVKNFYLKKFLQHKYILPFLGIIYCWRHYIQRKEVIYINYLPLWNFLIFLLLPPNTKIGPITGGALHEKFNIIRSKVLPLLYNLSEIILYFRNYDLIFSTNLLKRYLSINIIKKSKFNYLIKKFNYKNKKIKKKYDFLIYFRKHSNKKFSYELINNLINKGFTINVVGDKLKLPNIKNYGFVSNDKITQLQAKTKFSVFSSENVYTIFTLECITNNILVLVDKTKNYKLNFFKKSFIKINFNNSKELNKLKKL
jgi:hypothetical protein